MRHAKINGLRFAFALYGYHFTVEIMVRSHAIKAGERKRLSVYKWKKRRLDSKEQEHKRHY